MLEMAKNTDLTVVYALEPGDDPGPWLDSTLADVQELAGTLLDRMAEGRKGQHTDTQASETLILVDWERMETDLISWLEQGDNRAKSILARLIFVQEKGPKVNIHVKRRANYYG